MGEGRNKMSKVGSCHVDIVVRNYPKYQQFESNEAIRNLLSKCCKDVLIYSILSANSVIDLSDNKLAKIHGIAHVTVKRITIQHKSEEGVVSKSTKFVISSVHSEDYYRFSRGASNVRKLGGYGSETKKVLQLVHLNRMAGHLLHRPLGVVVHGPSGCGKTLFGKTVAVESGAILVKVDPPDLLKSEFGAGPECLKKLFGKAVELTAEGPVVLFFDDMEMLCPRQENSSFGNKQLASALMSEMDALQRKNIPGLLVMCATTAISAIDPLLRRPGRFDHEVLINVPNEQQREAILEVLTAKLSLGPDICLDDLARRTFGFVGADLQQLCEETFSQSVSSQGADNNSEIVVLKSSDFESALHKVTPSLKKSSNCVVNLQPVQWNEIGGLAEVKAEVKQSVEWPLMYPDALKEMDISPTRGLLLYGPPGCCKTTLVRAVATSCNVSLLSLNGAQVYSPYVGESERIISEAFQKARALAPSILFLDEIESLVGKRSTGQTGQSRVQERILSTLLNEMDGVGTRLDQKLNHLLPSADSGMDGQKMVGVEADVTNCGADTVQPEKAARSGSLVGVMLVGATNRADMLDAAILRPGRLDRHIYVPPPDLEARQAILEIYSSKMSLNEALDANSLAQKTEFYTGADLKNLCREAGLVALRQRFSSSASQSQGQIKVEQGHFLQALDAVKPSLSKEILKQYNVP